MNMATELELGQQSVQLSELVKRAAEDSYLALEELINRCPDQSDGQRKISLLKYIFKTRQRLLRLHVLTKWCTQIPLVQYCQQLEGSLSSHDMCFTQAADTLFFTHEGLQQARQPVYDVPSALEVLLTGTYCRLPKCVEDMGMQTALVGEERELALPKLDTLLRSRLLEASLPDEISSITVSDGRVVLRVEGEFKVQITLGYRGYLSLWRILHLELLVGERSGPLKLTEMQRFNLGDDLERRMAAADNPFATLYSILHDFCIALVMDTVIRQAKTLRQGRWRDAIRFELISDSSSGQAGNSGHTQASDGDADASGLRTPGLKIMYWLDLPKGMGGADSGCIPFLKIEPGKDQCISCSHNTYVIDPVTGNQAEFVLDQSCIDVEHLLLRAISCNIHTRLLEVQRVLKSNSQLYQVDDDIILKHPGDTSNASLNKIMEFFQKNPSADTGQLGEEVLCVRAYGLSYVALGINIRNGRFLLRSSRNLILSSAVTECEEALNQGSVTPAEVFISLRNKSILHVFASVGRFLGLKVYEKGVATVKLPKSVIQGPDLLLMGFPNCRNSYFLLIQLDIDFKPLFMLLESKQDSTGKSGLLSTLHIFRFNKIDIGRMQMVEDEVNLSLLENERLPCLAKDINGGSDLITKPGRCCESLTDAVIQDQGCLQSGFSSLADDVFEFDKWMPVSQYLPKQNNLLPSAELSPSSHIGAVQGNQQGAKFAVSPPAWDGNSQFSPMNNTGKISVLSSPFNNRLMSELNHRNVRQTGSSLSAVGHNYGLSTTISSPVRSPPFHKLSASKNYTDQELTSSKSSLHLGDIAAYAALDEDHLRKAMDSPKDGLPAHSSNRTIRVPPLRASPAHRSPVQHSRSSFAKTSPSGQAPTMLKSSATGLRIIPSACQTSESGTLDGTICDSILKTSSRKRCLSDIVHSIPSLQGTSTYGEIQKKRKTSELGNTHAAAQLNTQGILGQFIGRTCGNIISEANHGKVPSSIYVSVLLQVIRHCSLCIKHARLTSQMEALNIPYVEDVGLRKPSADMWFRLPTSKEDAWQHICLCLGRPGSMSWEVEVNDEHFRDLWELQKGKNGTPWGSGVRIANTSDVDSHIRYGPEGVVLSYRTVEEDSIKKLVADLQRLSNARSFAMGMRKLLEVKSDERTDAGKEQCNMKTQNLMKKVYGEGGDRMWECMRKTFKIEAVGLMSLWFSYLGSMPGIIARFVVEWESGKEGCTMHVSPDQLWPHTKFLEDFINGGEVASLLDCIRLTAGPLHALAGAIRPARMVGTPATGMSLVPTGFSTAAKTTGLIMSQGLAQNMTSSTVNQSMGGIPGGGANGATSGNLNTQNGPVVSVAGRGGPGIVPSSLLPTDVSVVLRSPYWIRIIYRKNFAVDMRCFAGDQVWLQPATPPKDGPPAGGSMPCPQFRPFIMEHVALGLNTLETSLPPHPGGPGNSNNSSTTTAHSPAGSGNRMSTNSSGVSRSTNLPGTPGAILNRVTNVNTVLGAQNLAALNPGLSLAGRPMAPATGVPVHVRGELNTAFIGLGDDGGYGGGWVPLAALKKVLRGILKYLGVLWLFSQLPDLLKVILRSILKENEGSLLNLDHEQPALRFFVGGYVFAVSVHRVQLLLQVLSVKRFHQQQQQQQQQQHNQTNGQDELTAAEIHEICEYFSGRVASEPYDASRVASFITLLTLPISVLREFLKLIAWKKGTAQGQVGDIASSQRPRVELCLECHMGSSVDSSSDNTGQGPSDRAFRNVAKSNIHYDRAHNAVDFGLTVVLDPANIPHVNAAGGAAWLPHCVSVRLRYTFGENPHMSLLGMEGSHGGRALWPRMEDWERCKQKVGRAVDIAGGSSVDVSQGRLRVVAERLQAALLASLHLLRKGATVNTLSVPGGFTG